MPIRGALFSPGRTGAFAQWAPDACKPGCLHGPWPGWNAPAGLRELGSLELDQDAHAWNLRGEPEALRSKCIWNITRHRDLSLHPCVTNRFVTIDQVDAACISLFR